MEIFGSWSKEITCPERGSLLGITAEDITFKVKEPAEHKRRSERGKPIYFVACPECRREIVIQESFSGSLPESVKATAQERTGFDSKEYFGRPLYAPWDNGT